MTLTTLDGNKLAKFRDNGLDILFNNRVVMRFEKTGQIFIDGKMVAINVAAIYGLRELLKNLERGLIKEEPDDSNSDKQT